MQSRAIVFDNPQQLSLQTLSLDKPIDGQLEIEVEYSGISTGMKP